MRILGMDWVSWGSSKSIGLMSLAREISRHPSIY